MNCPLRIFFLLFFVSVSYLSDAQTAIGQWRSHLPLNKGRFVESQNDKIICAAADGIFIYHTADNSLELLTKVNSLSDVGIGFMRYNAAAGILLVYYENGNLDLITGSGTINISDIKRKNIIGSKKVNDVMFSGNIAYLSADFGLIKLDLIKAEIKETYQMSYTGSPNKVYGAATDGALLYAATDSGVFAAPIQSPALNFLGSWTQILAPQPGIVYKNIIRYGSRLLVNYRSGPDDRLYEYNGSSWSITNAGQYDGRTLRQSAGKLIFTGTYGVKVFDENLNEMLQLSFPGEVNNMRDALADDNLTVWIADNEKGLVKAMNSQTYSAIVPDGPQSAMSAEIEIVDDVLWVCHSERGRKWNTTYSKDGFSRFKDGQWTTFNSKTVSSTIASLDTFFDPMSVAVDRRNPEHLFIGSKVVGVLEFENGSIKNFFNEQNSSLQVPVGNPGVCEIGDMAFDSNNNLWVVNSAPAPLSVYKTDGTWQSFSFPGAITGNIFAGELLIDSYNQKWADFNESGILVFDETRPPGSTRFRFLSSGTGTGGLPSADVRCMAEDQQGQIWVGTAKGVAVYYSPGSVLEGGINADAQQVLIYADGSYQYLLETEVVTAIAIDGANRKWFGTENSGVFLISADGTEELLRFNTSNSPLPSNNITALGINQKSGEVYIGTDKGMMSYRSDATLGKEFCDNTYAFPNPVRPGYEGPIAIYGLVNNGRFKITDISGTLVYENNALGGQAIWNGKNFEGRKVKSGVYLIFSTDAEGKNTCITKLLLLN